ncbi:MAG: L,D-transpeptidase [Cyanobacteria bacterium P01_G01_bin.49]
MRFQLALAFLSCLVVFIYTSNAKQNPSKNQASNQLENPNNIQLTINDLSNQKQQQWQDFKQSKKIELNAKTPVSIDTYPPNPNLLETPSKQFIKPSQPNTTIPISQDSYMTLIPTNTTNVVGNSIYELQLYGNGQLIAAYPTVTGQAATQNKNRHQEGTEAPLPDGKYAVASSAVPGTTSEVGEWFLPIEPLFSTGRTALGIHYDPSFQKTNGEDGTQGCIALTQKQDLDEVLDYVTIYQPQYLEVRLQT